MGKRSLRRRTPFVAAVAFLIGPERQRPTDDGTCGDGSEVAAVEAVADFPIHEEDFTVADDAAALPDGQIAVPKLVEWMGLMELRLLAPSWWSATTRKGKHIIVIRLSSRIAYDLLVMIPSSLTFSCLMCLITVGEKNDTSGCGQS